MPYFVRRLALLLAPALALAACGSSTGATLAEVQFRITSDRGPCSTQIGVRFLFDGAVLGEEEFQIGPNRAESSRFAVPAGTHVLGMQLTSWGGIPTNNSSAWPDTTVTLAPNQLLVHTLDLYCS